MNVIRLQGNLGKRTGIYYEYDADSTPLGEGGMGRVFKGYRVVEKTGERTPVAIKAIYENIPERVVERARREANIQLDNDNLIKMYEFVEVVTQLEGGKSKVYYHVIMELLIGVTLDDLLSGITSNHSGMQIPFAVELYNQYIQDRNAATIRIIKSVLSGLMALHDRGYIHRDIDPSNIMITIDGKIKLIDFGICKQLVSLESHDKALTATGVFMGKVHYAAPELVLGDVKNQNYTTDIYAMGILLYRLCAGHLPFTGTDQDILSANLRKRLPMDDVLNGGFKKIIRKATEKQQSKRYSSVAEFRVDIERIDLSGRTDNGSKIGVIASFVVVFLLVGVISYALKSNTDSEPQPVEVQPTCEELFADAMELMNNSDGGLMMQGRKKLAVLAEDSLYVPAQEVYYVLLINSKNSDDVQRGYSALEKMTQTEMPSRIALFESGVTLSMGNSKLTIPTERQRHIGIDPDLFKANEMLNKIVYSDTTDYRSAYWVFHNMMKLKIDNLIPISEDVKIVEMYNLFKKRIENIDDDESNAYRESLSEEMFEHLLHYSWGLI